MRRISASAFLVFSFASLAACSPQQEVREKEVRHVETVLAKAEPVSEAIWTTGEIRARVQSDLSFRVSGRIIERLVDVGDRVKAGQTLARIDAQEQEADLQVALATLQSAQAQQMQAQQTFDRQQSLIDSGAITRAAMDATRETLLRARATVESAQAQLDTARDTLTQTDLKADADGVITARNAEVGQVAQAAQLVFTLAHDGPRDGVFNADESAFLGQEFERVEVRMLSGGDAIKATVREISPTIDTSTGTIRIKLGLEDAPKVNLGSPVVAIAHYKPVTAIELPWSAMTSSAGEPAVWVVDPDKRTVSVRPVKVMTYRSESFSLQSGVTPGEVVVKTGTKFLSDGEVVAFEGAGE